MECLCFDCFASEVSPLTGECPSNNEAAREDGLKQFIACPSCCEYIWVDEQGIREDNNFTLYTSLTDHLNYWFPTEEQARKFAAFLNESTAISDDLEVVGRLTHHFRKGYPEGDQLTGRPEVAAQGGRSATPSHPRKDDR
jgi:hypothetical protein